MSKQHIGMWLIGLLCIAIVSDSAWAQRGPRGRGFGMDAAHRADMELFHFLLDNRAKITRKVTNLADGVETVTESDDPEVVNKLQAHVESMYKRVEQGRRAHSDAVSARDRVRGADALHADRHAAGWR